MIGFIRIALRMPLVVFVGAGYPVYWLMLFALGDTPSEATEEMNSAMRDLVFGRF